MVKASEKRRLLPNEDDVNISTKERKYIREKKKRDIVTQQFEEIGIEGFCIMAIEFWT